MLAERRSISAAAKDLHLTQSGMSRAIQALEATLGAQLFSRNRQGLALTDAGVAFKVYARRLAQSYADALAGVRIGHSKRMTLAISNIITPLVLPVLLRSMPQGQVIDSLALNEMASHQAVTRVASGAADLGLCMCADTIQQSDVEVIPLLSVPLGLLAGADVPLPQAVQSLAALAHLQLVGLASDMVLPQALRACGVQFDAYFASRIVSNSMSALFSAVACGQVVTLVSAVAAHSAPQQMQFLPLPHLLPPLQLCLVGSRASDWRREHAAWIDVIVCAVHSVPWPASAVRL